MTISRTPFAAFLALCLQSPSLTSAFVAHRIDRGPGFGIRSSTADSSTKQRAIIYEPDDDDDGAPVPQDSATFFGGGTTSLTYDEPSVEDLSLMESLASQHRATLAKLACAFVPPGHGFELKDVETVHVLEVDEAHIEISVSLCESQGCVAVSVPVSFPKPCLQERNLKDCIIDNIEVLEDQASTMISEYEWKQDHHEEIAASADMRATLISEHIETYPTWWVKPTTSIMGLEKNIPEECASVRNLLNEAEFQEELKALASQHLNDYGVHETNGDDHVGDKYIVEQAGVAAVGPAGFIMRVLAKMIFTKDSSRFSYLAAEEDDLVRILEVPILFKSEAKTIENLRASVLGAIASVVVDE